MIFDLAYFKQRLTVIEAGQEARKEESPLELDQTRTGRLSHMALCSSKP
jgi:hypothetical protein